MRQFLFAQLTSLALVILTHRVGKVEDSEIGHGLHYHVHVMLEIATLVPSVSLVLSRLDCLIRRLSTWEVRVGLSKFTNQRSSTTCRSFRGLQICYIILQIQLLVANGECQCTSATSENY